jgi:capsular exopolysaccharide synthesis family protein
MNQDYTNFSVQQKKVISTLSPREILFKYIQYVPWVILCVLVSLLFAFLRLRYQPNIYTVSGTLMVKDPNVSGRTEKIEDMLLMPNQNKSINDEIQVVKSMNIAKRVVRALGLEVQYYQEGKIRGTLVKASDCPFNMRVLSLNDTAAEFRFPVFLVSERQFKLSENQKQALNFDQPFETLSGRFILSRVPNIPIKSLIGKEFTVTYTPTDKKAEEYTGSFTAEPSGESTNIMRVTFETENPRMGIEIVNQWMREYQRAGLEENKLSAANTLEFINEQVDTVNQELMQVERNLLGFRERNRVIDPQRQSEEYIVRLSDIDKEITRQGFQMQLTDNLIRYISDDRNPYRQVGSVLGIEEPTLAFQISEFNKLQVERETLLKTTTRSNPMVVNMEAAIEKLRVDIIQNLRNVRQAYQLTMNGLSTKNSQANREIAQIPGKERDLLEITRRQKILQELYSFLLEKRLETSIGAASTLSNVKFVEPAKASYMPIRPNRRGTYLTALFLGIAIPCLLIFIVMEYLNDKVRGRQDVVRMTDAPIIGEVSHSEEKIPLVVYQKSRKFIAEQFRIIRTNLQYILPQQDKSVILITSSTSGEGKSFISTNMGAVMALSGKKTAILEFDIRKPKIMSGLGMAKRPGMTNYLIGGIPFEELPVQVPNIDNLFVIPCGPVPPNPSELILDSRLDDLMARLKEEFDVLIIDTAPVGLVSDGVLLGRFADACLYVVRHEYTFKKQLQMLDEYYRQKRLPRMCIVLNDITVQAGYGRYYGYGGYGYGNYGYGYGSTYFDDKKGSGGLFKKISSFFKKD